ncbi:chloride channel protein [Serpentinicella sp. ANB-PHB4]|uniref:chloride channel protein n=1 Tax=Serpentinicella sp. ANB-PHB4 TaxID=3074076 RepID=UPI00285BFA6F|nr:chloride channel protein [Serpentinicella sp. ANB-PHB4]MDR5659512.1 chloride channel protein [Serpentinicella sp. ANB-PHB4]
MKNIFEYVGKYMMKWILIATLVGIGGGLSAVALQKSIELTSELSKSVPLWIAPAIGGGLLSLIYIRDRSAAGFGTDRYISTINLKKDQLEYKSSFTKLISTAITLGFRGSGGVEGPMLVIGGGLSNGISKLPVFKNLLDKHDRRTLIICGAAGAIGAIFRSPLGGGIFVVEILYRSSLHYSDLFPAMLSSTMGFVVYSMISKSTPLFNIPDYLPNVYNVPFFVLAAILAGILSLIFMGVFSKIQNIFKKAPLRPIHPLIGGLLVGVILIIVPKVSGTGTSIIQEMIDTVLPLSMLLALFIGKIIATSLTVASGGSAGLVIPSLFIGAIAGNSVATIIGVGDIGLSSSLVIAGMAASLASVANVPVAAAVMLVEMVGLRLGVPATLGSIIGYAIGHSQVIYGVTNPDQWQFEEMKKLRKKDVNKRKH